ncbi:MAG TPA: hypothetical protein DEQ61_14665, partial [Streptomyces sp.]|nr:hypothetical protein [Streptomyces sp.]
GSGGKGSPGGTGAVSPGGPSSTRNTDSTSSGTGETVTVPEPGRAAQLARQRAALATAREKRAREADPERSGLRRSVLAEAGVAVLLLAVTTVLTSTEPARTADAARASAEAPAAASPAQPVSVDIPFDTGGKDGAGRALVDLDPGRTGRNAVHIRLEHPDGTPLDAPEVKLSFTLPAKNLGPLPVESPRIDAGHWSATDVQLPMTGTWELSLTVRTSDIDQVTETRNVKIG